MKGTIWPVSRSGVVQSSMIELASIRRAFGSSWTSMSESLNGCTGSRRWPITSVGWRIALRSSAGGATRPKNRPWSTDAEGFGSWAIQSSIESPR